MKFLLGKKSKMTQIFNDKGVCPVTMVTVSPMTITKILKKDAVGYSAVQVGVGTRARKNITKPVLGTMQGGAYSKLKEFRTDNTEGFEEGSTINPLEVFNAGDKVTISSVSKGKGFQGVVKRYGFKGQPSTHGTKHTERTTGSIGAGLNRVTKGKKMPGRMGGERVTIKNTSIVFVDKEHSAIAIKGAIPGNKGTSVEIIGT